MKIITNFPRDIKNAFLALVFSVFTMSSLLFLLGFFVQNPSKSENEPLQKTRLEPYLPQAENSLPVSVTKECFASEDADVKLLAYAAEEHFGRESYAARTAFCAVIINRTKDHRFPNSVSAVLISAGLFPKSTEGKISERTRHAAELALNGVDPTLGALYIMRTSDLLYDKYQKRATAIYGDVAFIG